MKSNDCSVFLAAACLVGLIGCSGSADDSGDDDDPELQAAGSAIQQAGAPTYLLVRRDTRDCPAPACGGFLARRVNHRLTRCFDGTLAPECYAPSIGLEALGLSSDEVPSLSNQGTVYRGTIEPHPWAEGTFGEIEAVEAWEPVSRSTPTDTFFHVTERPGRKRPGRFDLRAEQLNGRITRSLSDLGGPLGPDAEQTVGVAPILAAGSIRHHVLTVSEYYARVGRAVMP